MRLLSFHQVVCTAVVALFAKRMIQQGWLFQHHFARRLLSTTTPLQHRVFQRLLSTATPLQHHAYPARFKIQTRVQDTDLQGHLNNVNYYAFMDTAICGWCTEQGDNLYGNPRFIAETGLTYHSPAMYPETIVVTFGASHIGTSSVKYNVEILSEGDGENGNGERLLCSGHFVHVYVNDNGRPTPMNAQTLTILDSIRI